MAGTLPPNVVLLCRPPVSGVHRLWRREGGEPLWPPLCDQVDDLWSAFQGCCLSAQIAPLGGQPVVRSRVPVPSGVVHPPKLMGPPAWPSLHIWWALSTAVAQLFALYGYRCFGGSVEQP